MSDWKKKLQTNSEANSMVQDVLVDEDVYSCYVLKFPAWINPLPANVENIVLRIMLADGRWELTRSLKG